MLIDLVYPLQQGASKADDMEIRYSLRSAATNLRVTLRYVHLVGHRPDWLRVKHIPVADDTGDKALNLIRKYRAMCDSPEISDPFLLLDDDHMFLAPTDDLRLRAKGSLEELANKLSAKKYGWYLLNALGLLREHGLPERCFQMHYPMLIHKATLRRALDIIGDTPATMGSVYGNLADQEVVEVAEDCRINNVIDYQRLRDAPFVSLGEPSVLTALHKSPTGPKLVRVHLARFLAERFPDPSPWEIPGGTA